MVDIVNRLAILTKKIENDEPITKEDVNKVKLLQAIDIATIGSQFVNDTLKFNEEQDNNAKEFLNS